MTSIVYPLNKLSTWENNELRYSLRSIERYLSGFGQVFIVGEYPAWIKNVIHIPAGDPYGKLPCRNIMEKVKLACEHPEVSQKFLFMNDDHFLLKHFSAAEFPYFYSMELEKYVQLRRGQDVYAKMVRATMEHLKINDLPSLYYDIHTPILYDKDKFIEHCVNGLDWQNTKTGYVLKSIYANSTSQTGVKIADNKGDNIPKNGDLFFSTMPRVKEPIRKFLEWKFPDKSRFEK